MPADGVAGGGGAGSRAESRRIRSLRPPKPVIDPWRPIDVVVEEERLAAGGRARVLTVFLAGSECPFTCVFCDLWRFTTDEPTPAGAIPAQIGHALERAGDLTPGAHVKLYNASNFFDPRAVPVDDDPEILRRVDRFARVVVECHPKLVGRRCGQWADRLDGRLQVAMGLETVHPRAAARLGKQATPEDFARAADRLRGAGAGLRAFVLVGAPFVPGREAVLWVERSARFAFDHGAEHVALIPVRGGNGELERLAGEGLFHPLSLEQIEDALDRCLDLGPGVVTVDTWDLERLAACPACAPGRIARLERINLSGRREPAPACEVCEARR